MDNTKYVVMTEAQNQQLIYTTEHIFHLRSQHGSRLSYVVYRLQTPSRGRLCMH